MCSHTPFAKSQIARLNGHYPVITDFDNMAAALHSSDSLTLSLNLSRKPLTRWLLYNDHWNGSFSLIDTAWTLWYVSIRDHSSNSNDCCCGSQSRLMTSATGWGKCPPWCLSHSAHPSVSRPLEVTSYFGRHTVKRIFEYIHSCIHTWKKTDTHHPSCEPHVH